MIERMLREKLVKIGKADFDFFMLVFRQEFPKDQCRVVNAETFYQAMKVIVLMFGFDNQRFVQFIMDNPSELPEDPQS
jgi:hypothetical protein